MADIVDISNGEAGSSVRTKLNTIISWVNKLINSLFVSIKTVDLGTNGTTLDADGVIEVWAYGSYTANTTLTLSNTESLRKLNLGLTNTNANVLTIEDITVYFKPSQLPEGVSFASNALTFPTDTAVKYNIILARFHADDQFDGFIELRTEVV